MSKKTPSAPAPPDPVATANAQAAANKESAIATAHLNQVNQITPWGNLEFTPRGTASDGTPQYTATTTLSPDQQSLLDLTTQAQKKYGETANTQLGAVSDRLSTPLDFGSLGAAPQVSEATRQATADAMYARMNPQLEKDRAALETRLANQGITMGSEAWKTGFDDFNRQANDARLAVDSRAGDEMARMFGLESTARNQGINEMVQQRQIPLNELAAMLTGSQVQAPQFVNAPQGQINPADIMGATYGSYNGQMNAYNSAMQNQSAQNQGLYSLLGAGAQAAGYYFGGPAGGAAAGAGTRALGWSDRRLKRDVQIVGKLPNGLPVYQFRYNWSDEVHIGLMADEVRAIHPHAVISVGGYDMVDYSEAVR